MTAHKPIHPSLSLFLPAVCLCVFASTATGNLTVSQSDAAPTTNVAISQSTSDSNTPWRHNQQPGVDRNPRDAGQTFFVDAGTFPGGFSLDAITVRLDTLTTSGYDEDGFALEIYEFTDAADVVPDGAAFFTDTGNLPVSMKADFDVGSQYLTIDLADVTLAGGQQYGFFLMLDGPSDVNDNMQLGGHTDGSLYPDGIAWKQEGATGTNFLPSQFAASANGDLEFYLQGQTADTTDSDNDGLLDAFEQLIIDFDPNDAVDGLEDVKGPNDAPDTTDFDNDGASDAAEAANGTDPTDDDSDDDGLLDGVEDNTDTFVDADHTGTDPLDDDSDDDGLKDGVESGTMVFNGPSDTGSDPNKVDSDNDGFDDKVEVDANTDPSNPAATPPFLATSMSDAPPTDDIVISQSTSDSNTPWRHNQQPGVDRNPRDAGQTFFIDAGTFPGGFSLDAITVRLDTLTTSGYDEDGFALEIYEFTDAAAVVPDGPVIFTESGTLPVSMKADFDVGSQYLTIDLTDVTLAGGQQYGFFLMLDGPSDVNDNMQLGGHTDGSLYPGGIAFKQEGATGTNFLPSQFLASANGDLEFYLQGGDGRSQITVTHDSGTGNLSISWESQSGTLYNLRSETDPSAADPIDWPVFDGNEDLAATPPTNTVTFPLPAEPIRLFVVEEFPAPPASVFTEDFESGQGLWTVGAGPLNQPGTDWELGTPSNVGPASAHSPANCFGTNLDADYAADAEVWLRSPPIDLTTAAGATLSYFQFHDIETGFDSGQVAVLDSGTDLELALLGNPVDGASAGWEQVTRVLPAIALGKSVKIEFRLKSDDIEFFAGWYVDDVLVTVP